MAERFRDPVKAAQYLAHALQHDFPEGQVEIIRFGRRRRPRTRSCDTRELERVLVDVCRSLDAVDVNYHPKNAYGFVAEVCETPEYNNDPPRTPRGPRVYILLTRLKGRPIAVGSRLAPRMLIDLE